MKHIRSILSLACLATLAVTAGAQQGFRSSGGITAVSYTHLTLPTKA